MSHMNYTPREELWDEMNVTEDEVPRIIGIICDEPEERYQYLLGCLAADLQWKTDRSLLESLKYVTVEALRHQQGDKGKK